jgi:hypothetical protein
MRSNQSIQELLEEFKDAEPYGLHRVLFQARARGVQFDLERSVRVGPLGVYPKRLLVSFDSDSFHRAFSPDEFQPFRWMNPPSGNLSRLLDFFQNACRVHFGWELGDGGWIGKIYLELRPREIPARELQNEGRFEIGQLLFLGYKWSLSQQFQGVVSKYKILGHAPASEAVDLWRNLIVSNGRIQHSWRIGQLCEHLRNTDCNDSDLLVLEVCDEGSARVSYDINLYDLEQPIASVGDSLVDLIAGETSEYLQRQWAEYVNSIRDERLGHLATGTDRNGSEFWTLYYGAVRVVTGNSQ